MTVASNKMDARREELMDQIITARQNLEIGPMNNYAQVNLQGTDGHALPLGSTSNLFNEPVQRVEIKIGIGNLDEHTQTASKAIIADFVEKMKTLTIAAENVRIEEARQEKARLETQLKEWL